jgi:hypothetical protein
MKLKIKFLKRFGVIYADVKVTDVKRKFYNNGPVL